MTIDKPDASDCLATEAWHRRRTVMVNCRGIRWLRRNAGRVAFDQYCKPDTVKTASR